MERKWLALIGLNLLTFIIFLDVTIVSTALPTIQLKLNADLVSLQWVLNIFVLALSAFMVVGGKLGDIVGKLKIVYIGGILFGIASIGAALAPNIEALIFFRLLQGIASGYAPVVGALVAEQFEESEHSKALSRFAVINGIGLAVGPIIGGLLTEYLNWRMIFFINVPLILVSLFMIKRYVIVKQHDDAVEPLDYVGATAFVIAITTITVFIMQGQSWGWGAYASLGTLALFIASSAVLIVNCQRIPNPILHFEFFKLPGFRAALYACFGCGGIIGVGLFLNPLFLQNVLEYTPFETGITLFVVSGSFLFMSLIAHHITDRFSTRSSILFIFGLLLLSSFGHILFGLSINYFVVALAFVPFGFAWGLGNVAPNMALIYSVKPSQVAVGMGLLWTTWNLGSTIILAIAGLLFRYEENSTLYSMINEQGIQLNASQLETIKMALSDPEHALSILKTLGTTVSAEVLPLFKLSFINGFHLAYLFLIICFVALTLASYTCRWEDGHKSATDTPPPAL